MEDSVERKKTMRLRLFNIPSVYGVSQVRKFVANLLNIPQDAVVCRKGPKWSHAFLSFRPAGELTSVPDLEVYRSKLAGAEWKRVKLDAKMEEAVADPLVVARAREEPQELKCLNDQVTPLWKVPYEEQLVRKHTKLEALLRKNVKVGDDFLMEPIKASPMTTGYRNKCEFTVGHDKNGVPTVGFLLGAYKDGVVAVENAKDTVHIPEVLKALADHLESYVKDSGLAIFDRSTKEGFWRLMLARLHDGDVMAAVQITPTGMETKRVAEIVDSFVVYMNSFTFEGTFPLKSFFIQETAALHHGIDPKAPFMLKSGTETITQTLSTLKFRISPHSFFQVNQAATDILYSTIKEYVVDSLSSKTVLLDLCCGTGTIGMTLAPHVQRVVGVELVQDAINDAKANAQLNGIENISFRCERVEAAIEKVIEEIPKDQPIVVVLDPPRNGVHVSVIKAVRKCKRICRVVFVSCNPVAAANNFVDLTRDETKGMVGAPFSMRRAVAVDLFPQTEHCELVLQFHRD
ncbi:hypothetical protein PSACC_00786 [Paramicrosporidium saccamoebae]|uniref:tRNA (Uracil-5-)-methyltransferase n=1 Tax=Paramicrosporidium saccamoebae TaxID=1246581 RepID=A0A2H9TNP5_9FUNG|nr:hypothetical protein PSACC_00786 [Paramicrosporidium saccamoebae]